jgi:hypothetical protein
MSSTSAAANEKKVFTNKEEYKTFLQAQKEAVKRGEQLQVIYSQLTRKQIQKLGEILFANEKFIDLLDNRGISESQRNQIREIFMKETSINSLPNAIRPMVLIPQFNQIITTMNLKGAEANPFYDLLEAAIPLAKNNSKSILSTSAAAPAVSSSSSLSTSAAAPRVMTTEEINALTEADLGGGARRRKRKTKKARKIRRTRRNNKKRSA